MRKFQTLVLAILLFFQQLCFAQTDSPTTSPTADFCVASPELAKEPLEESDTAAIGNSVSASDCGQVCVPIEGSCAHCISIALAPPDGCFEIDAINNDDVQVPNVCCSVKENGSVCGVDVNVVIGGQTISSVVTCSLESTGRPTAAPSNSPPGPSPSPPTPAVTNPPAVGAPSLPPFQENNSDNEGVNLLWFIALVPLVGLTIFYFLSRGKR